MTGHISRAVAGSPIPPTTRFLNLAQATTVASYLAADRVREVT
jgi:hypothetical protein